jgi:hypothetical protein
MRCADVTRELAAPTGGLDPAELERHLTGCRRCSAWADRARKLDRIWEATRPAEPPESAFDAVWARVSQDAEAPARPAPARRRMAWGLAITGLAAAAAALLACLPLIQHPPEAPKLPTPPVAVGHYEVEPGEVLVIHLREKGIEFDPRHAEPISNTVTVAADLDLWVKAPSFSDSF